MDVNKNPVLPPGEESIFSENEFSTEVYDKHIRNARNILFGVAAVQFITAGVSVYITAPHVLWQNQLIQISVAVSFFLLGLWTKRQPFTAIVIALFIYIAIWIANSVYDRSYIYKAILLKLIIIGYLVKGLKDAKAAQDMAGLKR